MDVVAFRLGNRELCATHVLVCYPAYQINKVHCKQCTVHKLSRTIMYCKKYYTLSLLRVYLYSVQLG